MSDTFHIISFYEFKRLGTAADLALLRSRLRDLLVKHNICGTIIIAEEGFNASLCGRPADVAPFIAGIEAILDTTVEPRSSFHDQAPFRKHEVRIKPEIVTLKKPVDLHLGEGTHVEPADWNKIISDPDVVVLDTRNDYEYRTGTFRNALNPGTGRFSELPAFVDEKLDPAKHPKVAMFCTGGIRCEKFAPYMKRLGFREVFQLRGGILKYLEEVPVEDRLWEGECFVFDERVTLDEKLQKGKAPDLSQRHPEREEQ